MRKLRSKSPELFRLEFFKELLEPRFLSHQFCLGHRTLGFRISSCEEIIIDMHHA